MGIEVFYRDVLGAKLTNVRWSWGAQDPATNRVFLRVWEDNIEATRRGERVVVGWDEPSRRSNGFAERRAHLDQIEAGAEGFGIVCVAADPKTDGARRIAQFDQSILLRLGHLTHENGRTYAQVDARVPVTSVTQLRSAASTVAEDIRELAGRRLNSTTKEALVNARIGQGVFRAQVLTLWGHRCSVTGSTTLDAIRASHVKPWRESTNEERLDPHNGLPLVANLDALFDVGLISFGPSGSLIASPSLSDAERRVFGVIGRSLTRKPDPRTGEYLAYHRERRFRS